MEACGVCIRTNWLEWIDAMHNNNRSWYCQSTTAQSHLFSVESVCASEYVFFGRLSGFCHNIFFFNLHIVALLPLLTRSFLAPFFSPVLAFFMLCLISFSCHHTHSVALLHSQDNRSNTNKNKKKYVCQKPEGSWILSWICMLIRWITVCVKMENPKSGRLRCECYEFSIAHFVVFSCVCVIHKPFTRIDAMCVCHMSIDTESYERFSLLLSIAINIWVFFAPFLKMDFQFQYLFVAADDGGNTRNTVATTYSWAGVKFSFWIYPLNAINGAYENDIGKRHFVA